MIGRDREDRAKQVKQVGSDSERADELVSLAESLRKDASAGAMNARKSQSARESGALRQQSGDTSLGAAAASDPRQGARYGLLPWSTSLNTTATPHVEFRIKEYFGSDLSAQNAAGLGAFSFSEMMMDSTLPARYTDASGAPASVIAGNLLTLAAAHLVEAGRLDEAKRLLCPNVVSVPTGKLAKGGDETPAVAPPVVQQTAPEQLCAAIGSVMTNEDRLVAVRAARKTAETELLARRRVEVVVRKLAPDVLMRTAIGKQMGADAARMGSGDIYKDAGVGAHAAADAAGGGAKESARLLLTILLADTSEKTLDALKAMGIRIVSVKQEVSVVVASVPVEKVEELALMGVVRRVEMVEEEGLGKKE